jgi:hypothetical protein
LIKNLKRNSTFNYIQRITELVKSTKEKTMYN